LPGEPQVSDPKPSLPATVEDEGQLEELLARPSAADVTFARTLTDDVLVVGAGGKMGPSLARRIRRACDAAGTGRRVLAASRFSEPGLARALERDGIETLACDLLDPSQVARLPTIGNVLYLAGRKFGSAGRPDLTWAQNVIAPALVARHLASSRIVAFSTGNVYPFVGPESRGSTEDDAPGPVGEYAQSCLGRERVFEHVSREKGTRCLLFRLFYAVDLRYGTLVDVARQVLEGRPVRLGVPRVNAIWQGDANSYAFRALALCASPPRPLVVTGPDPIPVRALAERFGVLLDRPVRFDGEEGDVALLGDPARCRSELGPPEVGADRLIEWTAAWVARGGRSLEKPTHFETTDGKF
jgi:nucleoside-diphosphate-sugar epimerase